MSQTSRVSPRAALLLGTALALLTQVPSTAVAASMVDRGIERRVSDLEAEVRLLKNRVKALEDRKLAVPDKIVVSGNSRVKVTLYGQVNRAVRFAFASRDAEVHHVDNDNSSSRIGIKAVGRLFPDVTLSALTEVEWQENRRSNTNDSNDGNERLRARKVELWFTHATLGSLYLGHGSAAAKDVPYATLSGTDIVFDSTGCGNDNLRFGAPNGSQFPPNGLTMGAACSALDASRENRIMYRTPKIAGFWAEVSHGEGDAVEASIRYAGNPFGYKPVDLVAAFGYRYLPSAGAQIPGTARGPGNSFVGSIGALHNPTGLNAHFAAGTVGTPNAPNPFFYFVEAGWQGRVWAMGKTHVAGHFGNYDNITAGAHAWVAGVALRQKVDAAATDLYIGYRLADAKLNGTGLDAVHVIIAGARIKF